MYKLRIILIAIFFLSALAGKAQLQKEEVEVSLGKELKRSDQKGLQEIIGCDSDGVFTLQKKMTPFYSLRNKQPYTYLLQQYNADMNLLQTNRLSLKKEGKPVSYEFVLQLKDAIYLFSSAYEEGKEKKHLFARKISKQTLQPVDDYIALAELNKEKLGGHFSWRLSDNKSKLLLLYTYFADGRQTYDLHVFNNKLQKLWTKKNCMPHAANPFAIEQYEIDEEGNVYILSTSFKEERREKRKGTPDYTYHLTAYKKQGKEEQSYGIGLPGKFLTDIRIKIDREQDIIGGGFYAEEGTYSLEGSYFFSIDGNSSEVVAKSAESFAPGFLEEAENQFISGDKMEFGTRQLRQFGYRLNSILLRKDGSVVLLGEKYSLETRSSITKNIFGKTKTRSHYVYDYNNIIVVSMNREGEAEWTRKIKKQQHSVNDGGLYSSYRLKMVNGKLYTIFNSRQLPEEGMFSRQSLKAGATTRVVAVSVSRDGELETILLPELNNLNLRLLPRVGTDVSEGELVLLGAGEKNNRFIRLQVNAGKLLSTIK
jgi:hypothetical protein